MAIEPASNPITNIRIMLQELKFVIYKILAENQSCKTNKNIFINLDFQYLCIYATAATNLAVFKCCQSTFKVFVTNHKIKHSI